MKTISFIGLGLALTGIFAGRAQADTAKAAPVTIVAPRSVFTQPTNPQEGRDPFFPESTRVYESNIPVTAASEAASTLMIKGFSMMDGRPMVIINNHTFMAGDEGDVLSSAGHTHVHCLEIRPGTVVVEVNGARHEIHF